MPDPTSPATAADPRRPARRTAFASAEAWAAFDRFKAGMTGRKGEQAVAEALAALGVPALHDVILNDASGTTQIDHLVRGHGAIFVLETKKHGGQIDGTLNAPEWAQRFPGGQGAFTFQNPLHQNGRHCHAVRRILRSLAVEVRGLIVATGTATYAPALQPAIVSVSDLRRLLLSRAPSPSEAINEAWGRLVEAAAIGENFRDAHRAQFEDRP